MTVSGGDALSVNTRDLIAAASSGQVLYHVEGPDRAYVTGYAYPPVAPEPLPRASGNPLYYATWHQGADVVVLRIQQRAQPETLQRLSTVTVWQKHADRQAFARQLALQSAILILSLVATVALIIWFGVNRGLRTLLDLEDAIAARSPDDLNRIRREVPREVRGIVSTLNELFEQVRRAMDARDVFLSNAAHQLRNPVAGMLALAEAAEQAPSPDARSDRLSDLNTAAQRTARLTTQMLALERIKGNGDARSEAVDLNELAREVAMRNAERALKADIECEFHGAASPVSLPANRVMLEEALENLIDDALKHGGPSESRVRISVHLRGDQVALTVADDGQGLSPDDAPLALERFSQVHPSEGSGLGLAIVSEIAAMHSGSVEIAAVDGGAAVSILLSARARVLHPTQLRPHPRADPRAPKRSQYLPRSEPV